MFAVLARSRNIRHAVFIEPATWMTAGNKRSSRLEKSWFIYTDAKPKVTIFSPRFRVPGKRYTRLAWNFDALIWKLELNCRGLPLAQDILILNNPEFLHWNFVQNIAKKSRLCITDLSDDFVELYRDESTRKRIKRNIYSMVKMSHIVVGVNEHVIEKYAKNHPCAHVVRNATNMLALKGVGLEQKNIIDVLRGSFKCVLLCTGTINASRIDCELMSYVCQRCPETAFVFVGSVDSQVREALDGFVNIFFYDGVHYVELCNYIKTADGGFVPFLLNEHTRGNDLLKVYDFLALGKPVISTQLPTLVDFPGGMHHLLMIAKSYNEFVECCVRISSYSLVDISAEDSTRMSRNMSWVERGQEVLQLIEGEWSKRYGSFHIDIA